MGLDGWLYKASYPPSSNNFRGKMARLLNNSFFQKIAGPTPFASHGQTASATQRTSPLSQLRRDGPISLGVRPEDSSPSPLHLFHRQLRLTPSLHNLYP